MDSTPERPQSAVLAPPRRSQSGEGAGPSPPPPAPSEAGPPLFRARGLSLKVRLLLLVLSAAVPPIVIITVLYITSTQALLDKEFRLRGELVAKGLDDWM